MAKEITRRQFVKGLGAGSVVGCFATSGIASTFFKDSYIPEKKVGTTDIGKCKSVKITCISETSWFADKPLLRDIKSAGGALASQYEVPWAVTGVEEGYNGNNCGGYSTLVDIEQLDGSHKYILLDSGWNTEWMDKRFKEEGIDKMLQNDEIEFLFISHEHIDHYWGLESTFKHKPDIEMHIPDTFSEDGYKFMKGAEYPAANIKNSIPHQGKLVKHEVGKIDKLFEGVACAALDCPCGLQVFGEEVLIFDVQDKGICTVTGCCHMGILSLVDFIKCNIKGGDNIYGIYGGLHISPYEDWDPQYDDLILAIGDYNINRLGCNHCTGYITVEKMLKAGLQIIGGTAQNKTKRTTYLGNGDTLVF